MVSAVCALLAAISVATPFVALPPASTKSRCRVFGHYTFLTSQSNLILLAYHGLRLVAPESWLATHAFPLAFALGFGLTIMYYALCHFLEEKAREDKLWIEKGYTLIPIANHLEHGFALPLAVIDALFGGHAGETTFADTRLFVVGYIIFYLILILVNKKLTHEWVYPIFGVAEEKLGQPVGFLVLIVPIVLVYLSLAVLGQRLAG